MVRSSAVVMAVVVVAVAVGTYYGLGFVPPGLIPGVGAQPQANPAPTAAAVAPAPVSPATVAPAAAPPAEETPVEEPPAEETGTMPEAADDEDAAASPPPSAGTGVANYGSSEEIERALANEPPPEAGTVDGRAAQPAGSTPAAPESKAEAPAEPAPEAAPAKPVAQPKPAPAPKAESSAEPKAQAATAKPAPSGSRAPAADAIKQWWPDPASLPANQLKLVYAGQVQGQPAIALLFSDALDLASLQANARIKDKDGAAVSGTWEVGKNPKLAIFKGLAPGRYTVVLSPAVTGGGFMLGRTLQGPVYVQAS